jgi:hypothetical protein
LRCKVSSLTPEGPSGDLKGFLVQNQAQKSWIPGGMRWGRGMFFCLLVCRHGDSRSKSLQLFQD